MAIKKTIWKFSMELSAIKKECDEVQEWLLKKKCTCIDVRGENPSCEPCKAIDLIDTLLGIALKSKPSDTVVVPREPTREIYKAMADVLNEWSATEIGDKEVYEAIIAAASQENAS